MCPRDQVARPFGTMKPEVFARLLEQLRHVQTQRRIRAVWFTGFGDNLLHSGVGKYVGQVKQALGTHVGLTTNGLLLTPERLRELKDAGLDKLTLSVHSVAEDHREIIRGAPFERVVDSVRLAVTECGQDVQVGISCVEMGLNEKRQAEFIDFWQQQGVRQIEFVPAHSRGGQLHDPRIVQLRKPPTTCNIFLPVQFVAWNGDLLSCCSDLSGSTRMANIMEDDLEQVLEHKEQIGNPRLHFDYCKTCLDEYAPEQIPGEPQAAPAGSAPRPERAAGAPLLESIQQIAAKLDALDAPAVAHSAAGHRRMEYPIGSVAAEELALVAGWKPLAQRVVSTEELASFRALWKARGFAVEVLELGPGGVAIPRSRRFAYVSRDAPRLRKALVAHEANDEEKLGELLGYPRCCVEAYLAASAEPVQAYRRGLSQTRGRCHPRLNNLDLGVFHYLSWVPCSFSCELSLRWTDAMADRIRAWDERAGVGAGSFLEQVDEILGAHRLVVLDELQFSMTGAWSDGRVAPERVWPTFRDRHPGVAVDGPLLDTALRMLPYLESARSVEVVDDTLYVDQKPLLTTPELVLVPFGAA